MAVGDQAFDDDDEDRIAGLDVNYHDVSCRHIPAWWLRSWAFEALGEPDYIRRLIAD